MLASRIVIVAVCLSLLGGVWWMTATGAGVGPLQDDEIVEEAEETCPQNERLPNGDCPPRTFRSYFLMGHYTGGPGMGK